MSSRSSARAQRRAMKSAGIVAVARRVVEKGALRAIEAKGARVTDYVGALVAEALVELDVTHGADVLAHTVVTIGSHPDHPGAVTVEVKAGAMKPATSSCDCPVDHAESDEDCES